MKKILLGTTALIGMAAFSGAASADTPKVTLGGFADFQVGVSNQDLDDDLRSHSFRSDTEVTLRIDGVMDNGLKYGGGINLEADVDGDGDGAVTGFDNDNQGFNASQTYLYVEGMWGRMEMGSRVGVTNTMKVDASSIARATGGIDGDWRYFTAPTIAGGEQFIATPDLILDYGFVGGVAGAGSYQQQFGDESTENNNKVTYYTPRFAGFQVGLSYIVDSTGRGQLVSLPDADDTFENIFAGGINWEGKWDQFGIMLAATGEMGSAEDATVEDIRTWNLGAKFTYMGFSLAGSYGDWGDSARAVGGGLDESHYWTVGGAYETGPFGFSVTYINSQFDQGGDEDEFDNISVGVDYKMAPGFTPYAEVSFLHADPAGAVAGEDNDATIFIAGTQLAF
jgi:predicted porin